MCGIIGYIGPRNAKDVILGGLERMEYRGYDSAGLALNKAQEPYGLIVQKAAGRLSVLKQQLENQDLFGESAIGHTRWATHGAPSDLNAHPQKYGRVTLVHNGIFENYVSLKESLTRAGHSFLSSTDTEVAAHLLDSLLNDGHEALKAISLLCEQVIGLFALGIIIEGESGRIYFAKRGTPLIIAQNESESFFASDQAALVEWQPKYYALNDSEIGFIERDHVFVFDHALNQVSFMLNPLSAKLDTIEKQGYKHFMHKEIFEQPRVVEQVLLGRVNNTQICLEGFDLDFSRLDHIQKIHIIACGSSYYAGLIAKPGLEARLGLPVEVEIASEYRYRQTLTNSHTLVIAISQSGETADTIAALEKAFSQNALCMAVCNVLGSTIANRCGLSVGSLMLNAGPEISVASTKAFIAQVLALKLFTIALAKHKNMLLAHEEHDALVGLMGLKDHITRVLQQDSEIALLAEELKDEPHMLYIARGELFPVALEGALKMKELAYIFAEGYAAGELKHGPIATIDQGMPAVVLFSSDHLASKTASNMQEMKARGAKIISVGPTDAPALRNDADFVIDLGVCDPWLLPILTTIPLQLLAYHLSVLKGLDVDKPRNLAKSVTVE